MVRGPILLYLHLPKTAGSSFSDIIYDECNDSTGSCEEGGMFCSGVYYFPGEPGFMRPSKAEEPYRAIHSDRIVQALGRSDLRAVVGHFSFGLHTLVGQPFSYLTMVRHPLDRIASLFYHLKQWPRYGRNEPWLERVGLSPLQDDVSLDDFVRTYPLRELDNDQTRRVAGQEPGYRRCDHSLLEAAKSNIERYFSFLGVMERFEESIQVAANQFGWTADPTAYRENVNPKRPTVSSIARDTRETILDQNRLDLELYSFANAWLDDRLRDLRSPIGTGSSHLCAR